uniref:Thymidine kinase n=1 Tax=Ditylenchus dipsaci TaxID=166011 RepID=A0A915E758_9BILA
MDCQCQPYQCHWRGSIHLIIGPMFSGKTTELFRLTKRHTLAGKKVVVVKYARDNRYDATMACTHDLNKMEAVSAVLLGDVFHDIEKYDVIGIDEGQFFEDVVLQSEIFSEIGQQRKNGYYCSFERDYLQKPFQNITMLFSLAERIDKLSAVCQACGHSASFTHRKSQSAKRELIGGEEIYQAVCRVCLFQHQNDQNEAENESLTRGCSSPVPELSPVKRMLSLENFDSETASLQCKKRANA